MPPIQQSGALPTLANFQSLPGFHWKDAPRGAPVDLCQGCDTELGPDRYCPNCEEVMETYPWVAGEPAVFERKTGRVG